MKYLLIKVDPEEYKKYISLINPDNIIGVYDKDPEAYRDKVSYGNSISPAELEHLIKHGFVDLGNGIRFGIF